MQVTQIYELMNDVTNEILGIPTESGEENVFILNEDLSNVVDMGKEIFDNTSVDNYVKSLLNRIGKVIFVNRPYSGSVPSILMDSWEYGSVVEKIQAEMPEATENESWNLQDGESYPTDIFYKPTVTAKFFNSKVTFEIPMSFTELQVKESFASATELNSFLSMLYNAVDKAMTVKIDSLIMRTINNMTAQTIYSEYVDEDSYGATSTNKAVNLLYLYNQMFNETLSVDEALVTPEFIRFASLEISKYKDRLSKISTLFNIGGKARFTRADDLHIVMLSDFVNASRVYLESDVYHNELVSLPTTETVPYWQGSGEKFDFTDISKIDVSIDTGGEESTQVTTSGILAVMFDTDACGVCNTDRRVTTQYNARAEFFSNWYKFDSSYFNDTNENFVVFFIAETEEQAEEEPIG